MCCRSVSWFFVYLVYLWACLALLGAFEERNKCFQLLRAQKEKIDFFAETCSYNADGPDRDRIVTDNHVRKWESISPFFSSKFEFPLFFSFSFSFSR